MNARSLQQYFLKNSLGRIIIPFTLTVIIGLSVSMTLLSRYLVETQEYSAVTLIAEIHSRMNMYEDQTQALLQHISAASGLSGPAHRELSNGELQAVRELLLSMTTAGARSFWLIDRAKQRVILASGDNVISGFDVSRLDTAARNNGYSGWSSLMTTPFFAGRRLAYSASGESLALIAWFTPDALLDLINQKETRTGLQTLVADAGGRLLYHSNPSLVEQNESIYSIRGMEELRNNGKTKTVFSRYIPDSPIPKFYSSAYSHRTGWIISISNSFLTLFRFAVLLVGAIIAAYIIAASLIVVNLMRTSSRIQKGVDSLMSAAGNIAAGDYEYQAEPQEIDDFSQIADELVKLGMAVHSREQRLRKLNEGLETQVLERTEKLESINEELTATLDDLRQTQTQLIESEKLAAIGNMVAGIAHEINTPLGCALTIGSAVREYSIDFLTKLEGGNLTRTQVRQARDHISESIEVLVKSLENAAELIRSFKQVTVDQSNEERRQFILIEVLQDTLRTLYYRIRNRNIDVEFACNNDIVLNSFPGALSRIISNLFVNSELHAFDNTEGGIITIDCESRYNTLRISFSDNGSGIDEAHLGRIFDPFFTTRLGKGGSGLGLNIVYNLVTSVLGGRIRVESPPKGRASGSSFILDIPLNAPLQD